MDAPVDHAPCTSDTSTEGGIYQIKDMVSKGESAAQHLHQQVAHFVTVADAHIEQLRMHNTTLSHAHRLPPELIAEIFMLCPDMRLTFCQICSTWRDVAISTSRLWTTIQISMLDDKFDSQMLWLQTLCDRAGVLPLSVRLDRYNFTLNKELSAKHSPITTLVPYFSRIQHLQLSLSTRCCQSLSSLPTISLPLLESCSVYGMNISDTRCLITVFETAHRLRRVSISDLWHPNILPLPLAVVDLNLDCIIDPVMCLDVLRQCSSLQEFSGATLTAPSLDNQNPDSALLLPRLHSLSIMIDNPDGGELLFDYLIIPSLADVYLIFCSTTWTHSSFVSLLARSACSLKKLTLIGSDMDGEEFLECLRALPSLVHCDVEDVDFLDESVLDALVYSEGGSSNLVPKLETFIAQGSYAESSSIIDESFMDMVESRWWPDPSSSDAPPQCRGVSRLSFAKLHFTSREPEDMDMHLDVLRRKTRLRQQGLAVYVE